MSEVELVEVEPQRVIGMRRRGPYSQIGEMLGELAQYAVSSGVQLAGPPVYLSHEMSEEEAMAANEAGNADIEVTFPVIGQVEGTDKITVYELPGGTMAKTLHRGPYDTCTQTYRELFAWLEENGKQVTGPIREVYLNDPGEVEPKDILTEIYAPVD